MCLRKHRALVVRTLSASLTGGATYRLIVRCRVNESTAIKDPGRALIASFVFFSGDAPVHVTAVPGLAMSEKYGLFHYIRLLERFSFEDSFAFTPPYGASRVEIHFHDFHSHGAEITEAVVTPQLPIDLHRLPEFLSRPDTHISLADKESIAVLLVSKTVENPRQLVDALGPHTGHRYTSEEVFDLISCHYFDARFRSGLVSNIGDDIDALLSGNRDLPHLRVQRGAAFYINGDRASAYQQFIKAASSPRALGRMFLGAYSIKPYNELASIWNYQTSALQEVSALEWVKKNNSVSSPHIVFGCDARFFVNFASDVCTNLYQTGNKAAVHFHVSNWSAQCSRIADSLDASISIESAPNDRTWFATSRFYRVAEFLNVFNAPVLVADIDIKFNKAPVTIPCDIAFRTSPINHLPWYSPTGGCVYFSNTANGIKFAEYLRRYIATRFRFAYPRSWWFDQLALNELLHASALTNTSLNIGDVGGLVSARLQSEVGALKWGTEQ